MKRFLVLVLGLLVVVACSGEPEPFDRPQPTGTKATADVPVPTRQGTREVRRVGGDLNGDGTDEVVVQSESTTEDEFGRSQPYVDAYAREGEGWTRILDAQTYEIDGGPILVEEDFISQGVSLLDFIDFARDDTPELVVAIANFGASAGPIDLTVLSWDTGPMTTEFTFSTERGGEVSVREGLQIVAESGIYDEDDAGCCPSKQGRWIIGYDEESKTIGIVEKTETPVDPAP